MYQCVHNSRAQLEQVGDQNRRAHSHPIPEDGEVLSPAEIRDRLRDAAAAAFAGDTLDLAVTKAWLETLTGRDLLRVDGLGRQFRFDGPTLGKSQEWTRQVLESSDVCAAIASMHRDGRVRERAVRALASSRDALSDRMVALRVDDYVEPVRALATATLMTRTSLDEAASTMPVLHRFQQRERGSLAAHTYLERLLQTHGAGHTWEMLRTSTDRDLRRSAYRHSIDASLIDVDEAVSLLPRERDQVVRRAFAHVIADHGQPSSIRDVLLRGRSAEGRVLGLVRLQPPDLTKDDVLPLLADTSVLVRFWARKRWLELGGDAAQACRDLIEAASTPARRERAYVGLSETGTNIDRSEILDLVCGSEPALQKVGLRLLAPVAAPEDLSEVLGLVRSENSRVARLAIDVLAANLGLWSLADVADLKRDADPEIRRRAWLLHRSRGGWESLICDLEILGDSDAELARLGAQPKAPMYLAPSDDQRGRIGQLLHDAPLKRDLKLGIAFAAGLKELTAELRSQPRWPQSSDDPRAAVRGALPAEGSQPWWRRLLQRLSNPDGDG